MPLLNLAGLRGDGYAVETESAEQLSRRLPDDPGVRFSGWVHGWQSSRGWNAPLARRVAVRTRKLITILDDDPSVLRSTERLLKAHGFDTEIFETVEGFLARARLTETSCLVLDVNLNRESGIELQRELKASGVSLPVIFMSGSGYEAFREEALKAGCLAYLRKPFTANELIDPIEQIR
jgi:CheY-like chemotaxis protein